MKKNWIVVLAAGLLALLHGCIAPTRSAPDANFSQLDGADTARFEHGKLFLKLTEPFVVELWRSNVGFEFSLDDNGTIRLVLTSEEAGGALGDAEIKLSQSGDKLVLRHKRSGAIREFTRTAPTVWLTFPNTKW